MSEVTCSRVWNSFGIQERRYFAAHLYIAEVDGGAIFLDLRSLQYYALDAPSLGALHRHIVDCPQGSLFEGDRERQESAKSLLDSFFSRGLLSSTLPKRQFPSSGVPAQAACHPIWNIRARPYEVLLMICRLATAYLLTLVFLRMKRLDHLLTRLASTTHAKVTPSQLPSQENIRSLVTLFAKLRVWFYTAKDQCLLDSLVLLAVLRKYNVPSTITIGVAPKPFSAHAWVQVHDYVVDDSVEHVREFTPILVA
jgi:Transglutaminase-like superfamily